MIQSPRVLLPDGLFLAAWGETLRELRSLATAESTVTGGCRPACFHGGYTRSWRVVTKGGFIGIRQRETRHKL